MTTVAYKYSRSDVALVLGGALGWLGSFLFLSHGCQTPCKKSDNLKPPCCKTYKLCGKALQDGTLCGEAKNH